MQRRLAKTSVVATVVAAAAIAGPAQAADLTLNCARADVIHANWNAPIKFVFADSGESGTLTVSGPFGDFTIPAKRAPMPVEPGVQGEAIDGVAKTRVKLPELSQLRACIGKSSGAAPPGSDDYLNAQQDCLQKLESADVEAVAEIRLGTVSDGDKSSGEDAFVTFKLRYETAEAGDKIAVEAFPARCAIQR
jgi:hypothetical protein